jgi:hypothetical protein
MRRAETMRRGFEAVEFDEEGVQPDEEYLKVIIGGV